MYDVMIKGGTVLDPKGGLNAADPICIKDGVFQKYGPGNQEEALHVIDAADCYVVPGLIDPHVHVYKGGGSYDLNTSADLYCIPNGVTTCIDGGSTGPLDFEGLVRGDAAYSTTNVKAMLHLSFHGVLPLGYDEDEDPDAFDLIKAKRLVKIYGGKELVGLKVRMHKKSAGKYGIKPLKKTIEFAEEMEQALGQKLSVAVHVTDLADDIAIDDIVSVMRRGDVYTHTYMGIGPKTIMGGDRKIIESIIKARERGIIFDSGGGSRNYNMNILKEAFEQGFYPDFISTDGVGTTAYRNNFSILHHASLYLNLGMGIDEIVKAMTLTPAECYGITGEAGTFTPGTSGDVAIFKIVDRKRVFHDAWGNSHQGNKLIVPMATVKNGRIAYMQIFM